MTLPPVKWSLTPSNPMDSIISYEGSRIMKICNDVNSKSIVFLDIGTRIELKPGDCHTVDTSKFSIELPESQSGTAFGTYQIIS